MCSFLNNSSRKSAFSPRNTAAIENFLFIKNHVKLSDEFKMQDGEIFYNYKSANKVCLQDK